MIDATVPLEEIDLSSHDAFVERVPHEWFRTLRHEDPVHFNPEPDGPGFYAVTRYEDIRAVHRSPKPRIAAVFMSVRGYLNPK